ncbi:hypothetical protein PO124_17755 [Bacillus licheniformis]|nr:hypothetical protein [Bacillus licheniformis]
MGTLPGWLPGYQHITDDKARKSSNKLTAQQSTRSPDLTTLKCFTPLKKANESHVYRRRRYGFSRFKRKPGP